MKSVKNLKLLSLVITISLLVNSLLSPIVNAKTDLLDLETSSTISEDSSESFVDLVDLKNSYVSTDYEEYTELADKRTLTSKHIS